MRAVRCHFRSQSHPDVEVWCYVGLSNGPSLKCASGETPNFRSGDAFSAEAHPSHQPLILPALWPHSQLPCTHVGSHRHRGRERTITNIPPPSMGWSVRAVGLRGSSPTADGWVIRGGFKQPSQVKATATMVTGGCD